MRVLLDESVPVDLAKDLAAMFIGSSCRGVEPFAEAAQTNKMTLYRYFDSKEAWADVSG